MTVPIDKWGKDHWSVFAYIETLCVDGNRVIDHRRMRRDGVKYPTRLKGMEELPNHNDWDCADDIEAAGLAENAGTGINRLYKLTEKGFEVAALLRKHKANGGWFSNFVPEV